jgi:integral membrane protein
VKVCLDLGMPSNPFSRFRVLSFAEGISFLLLLIFGSLLSRISDIDLVMPLGVLHAVLFIALVVATFDVRARLGWGIGTTVVALAAAVLPLGPFVFHHAKREELRAAEQTGTVGSAA